ncbi:Mus7/MMS22 family-domain-containing protein [Lipomyces tetrasporus]|uniref:Mus7/MMS22 family-domain-containing protein n=1 Tax=Lipomyces tetrasporus TaxID=54092 RepID=A0AAD7VUZ7_9ASCO|nr:Mus7/MMS22 family-domain-containing protein [Lipomyces tetrasporus]KAJ8101755.1 Mus7/MMS22 family-domain-containing protein [Lipomyces tetrasporus]
MPQSQGYVSDSEDSGSFSPSEFQDDETDELEFLPFVSISTRSEHRCKPASEEPTLEPEQEKNNVLDVCQSQVRAEPLIPEVQRVSDPDGQERIIGFGEVGLLPDQVAHDHDGSISKGKAVVSEPHRDKAGSGSSTPPQADHTHYSLFTSPLSSPLSELSSPPDLDGLADFLTEICEATSTTRSTTSESQGKPQTADPQAIDWEQENIETSQYNPRETHHFFRKRTARQINPYLFDRQMYEMALKRRGIKPIRVSVEKRISIENNSDDSQFTPPTDSLSSQSGASRIPSTQDTTTTLDTLLQPLAKVRVTSRHSSSRNIQRQSSTEPTSNRRRTELGRHPVREATKIALTPTRDVFDFPTSPPPGTQSSQGRIRRVVSTYSLRRTSPTQTTPSKRDNGDTRGSLSHLGRLSHSSEPCVRPSLTGPLHRVDSNTASVDEDNQLVDNSRSSMPPWERQHTRFLSVTSISDTRNESLSESDSDSEDDFSELELEKLKRRVRGVLPPSFLTLENSLRRGESSHWQRPAHSAPEEFRKGLARRKMGTSRPREETTHESIGDPESDSDLTALRSQASTQQSRLSTSKQSRSHIYVISDSDSDLEVDTHVDRMTSRETRSRRSTPLSVMRHRKRQSKSHMKGNLRQTVLDNRSKKMKKRSERKLSKKGSASSPSKLPNIGILDAYMTDKNPEKSAPQFLKIAVRQAARRDRFGRDSPSRKSFHFDDSDDNEAVSEVLQQWREGTHEAFETASVSFSRSAPMPDLSRTDSGKTPPEAIQKAKRRLPSGVIAIVPPPRGVVQEMAPPPVPQRNRLLEYVEVENGEYAVRPRPVKIDHLFENRYRIVEPVLQKRNPSTSQVINSRSGNAQPPSHRSNRKTRKEVFMRPRQHIRPEPTPSFNHMSDGDDVAIDRHVDWRDRDDSRPAVGPNGLQYSSQSQAQQTIQPQAEDSQAVAEFNFSFFNFSVTFDVFPLWHDTRFRASTFIGRGALDAALQTPPVVEDKSRINMSVFHFEERNITFLWTQVSSQLLEELDIGFGILLDWALSEQHNAGQVDEERGDQSYEFCVFLSNYIRNSLTLESYENVMVFAAAIKRLSMRIIELFTQFHGRSTSFSRLSFYMLGFQLLYIYEMYSMLQDHIADYSYLALDREFITIGRLLIQVLLKYGIDDLYQFLRKYRNRIGLQIDREFYFVEIWVMAIHVFDRASMLPASTISSFWESLYEVVEYNSYCRTVSIDKFERVWYATFSICPLYQFDSQGVSDIGKYNSHWNAVEVMMERLLSTPAPFSNSREFGSYCRACFSRCLTLMLTWKWPGTKSLAMKMYRFFAQRKLENLASDIGTGFPDFLQDHNNMLELSTSDTVFHIFLKYLAKLIRDTSKMPDARKILPGLIGLVTPLHGRIYPRTAELRLTDLEALENNYSLLLALFWAAPPDLRPPIGHLRDVIILGQSHSQARILSVKSWYYLTRLELRRNSDLLESGEWYQDLVKYSLDDYMQLERVVNGISHDEVKRRKANLKGYESLLKDSLKYVRMIICAPNLIQVPDQAIQILQYTRLGDVLNNGLALPEKVMLEAIQIIHDFVDLAKRILKGTSDHFTPILQQPDSQDSVYGDDSFVQRLVDDENRKWIEENRERLAWALVHSIFNPLYQLLSNLIGAADEDERASNELVSKAIETWALLAQFLVSAKAKDWNYFLEGRGAWKWFAETRRKATYEEFWLSRVATFQREVLEYEAGG